MKKTLWLTLIALLFCGELFANVTVNVSDDTYVRGGSSADSNYGTAPLLIIKDTNNPFYNREVYLKFNLSGQTNIQKVTLQIYAANTQDGTVASILCKLISDDSWDEAQITWNTKPPHGATIGAVSIPGTYDYYEIDITSTAIAEINNNGIISLVLLKELENSSQLISVNSKENTANPPKIKIEYATVDPTPTPTPSEEIILNPTHDAYIRSGIYNNINYGSELSLKVKNTANVNYNRLSYLQFDLNNENNFESATLRIYGSNTQDGTPANLYCYTIADDTWDESYITGVNAPAMVSLINTIAVNSIVQYYEFDVTSFALSEAIGDGIVSFGLSKDINDTQFLSFNAKESGVYKPELVLRLGSQATPTPTPTVTPTPTPTVTPTPTPIVTPTPTPSEEIILNPTHDTYIRSGIYNNINYGSELSLKVKNTANVNYNRLSYLQFDLNNENSFESATLRIYGSNTQDGTSANLYCYIIADDTWDEYYITGVSAPAMAPLINTIVVNSIVRYYEFDVTSFVLSEAIGDGIVSFGLSKDVNPTQFLSFNAKESGVYKPQLVLRQGSLTPTPTPTPQILSPIADAHVRGGTYDNDNYGSSSIAEVKTTANLSYCREMMIKFNVSDLETAENVFLRLYGANVQDGTSCLLYCRGISDDSWSENSITWATKPSLGAPLATVSVNNTYQYYEMDVSSFVNSEAAGDGIASFILQKNENNNQFLKFNSRENTLYPPELETRSDSGVSIIYETSPDIASTYFTLSRDTMKMSVQMKLNKTGTVYLEIDTGYGWQQVASATIDTVGFIATFKRTNWPSDKDVPYRIRYNGTYFNGTVKKDPINKDTIVSAVFTGYDCDIYIDVSDVVTDMQAVHQPDILIFTGDQVYNHDYHTNRWIKFCEQFKSLLRDIPMVALPDDHDVGNSNLWGAGGVKSYDPDGKDGGYYKPASYVNMVFKAQTSHLPDAYDPTPILQGINVFYTDLQLGGVSFALIEERKWKSAPDVPDYEAILLGDRQLQFIEDWAQDWDWNDDVWMKVYVGASPLVGQCTSSFTTNPVIAPPWEDKDINGWPKDGRDNALYRIRKAYAVIISGDQHLGMISQLGLESQSDSCFQISTPSLVNHWTRYWLPGYPGNNKPIGAQEYTGEYTDYWGSPFFVYAYANPALPPSFWVMPELNERANGYSIVKFHKSTRQITMECFKRRFTAPLNSLSQFEGWPMTIDQDQNYAKAAVGYLKTFEVHNITDPVIQVIDESNGEIVYTKRIKGTSISPKVFAIGYYTVKIGMPGVDFRTYNSVHTSDTGTVHVYF